MVRGDVERDDEFVDRVESDIAEPVLHFGDEAFRESCAFGEFAQGELLFLPFGFDATGKELASLGWFSRGLAH